MTGPADRDGWLAEAAAVLAALRGVLRPFGAEPAPGLRIAADLHPCPGYTHDDATISFCPPVIERKVDELRWLVFRRTMGCEDLAEVRAFYADALPYVVCHETSHHLRMSRGLAHDSHWVEEQVCDRLAVAMVAAMPAYAGSLLRLGARCERMRRRLSEQVDDAGWANQPGVAAVVLASRQSLPADAIAAVEARAARGDVDLVTLLPLVPGVTEEDVAAAREARDRARRLVDTDYARDPASYWHQRLAWLSRYLAQPRRDGLSDAVARHLSRPSAKGEEVLAMRQELRHPSAFRRGAAALGLLEHLGAEALAELADAAVELEEPDPVLRALADRWRPAWDPAVARRATRGRTSGEALRLCARAGVEPDDGPPTDARGRAYRLAAEGDDGALERALGDPATRGALLEALVDLGRPAPPGIGSRAADARERRWLVRLAARASDPTAHADVAEAALRRGGAADSLAEAADLLATCPDAELRLGRALGRPGSNAWRAVAEACRRHDVHPRPDGRAVTALRCARLGAGLGGDDDPAAEARRCLADAAALRGALPPDARGADLLRRLAAELVLEVACALGRAPAALDAMHERLRASAETVDAWLPAIARDAVPETLRDAIDAAFDERERPPPPAERLPAWAAALLAFHDRAPPGYDDRAEAHVAGLVDKLVHLHEVPMFRSIDPGPLADLAARAAELRFDAGEVLFTEGDPGRDVLVLIEGCVAVSSGGRALTELGPPSCFGEIAVFERRPRSATVTAVTRCRLLALDGDAIEAVGRDYPEVYEAMLRVLSGRLRRATSAS